MQKVKVTKNIYYVDADRLNRAYERLAQNLEHMSLVDAEELIKSDIDPTTLTHPIYGSLKKYINLYLKAGATGDWDSDEDMFYGDKNGVEANLEKYWVEPIQMEENTTEDKINIIRGYDVIDNYGKVKMMKDAECLYALKNLELVDDDTYFYDEDMMRYSADDLTNKLVLFRGKQLDLTEETATAEPTIDDHKAELERSKQEYNKWNGIYQQYVQQGNKNAAFAKYEADMAKRNIDFLTRRLKKMEETFNESKKDEKEKFLNDFYKHEGLDNAGWRRWVIKSIKKFGKDITGYTDKAWIKKQMENNKINEAEDNTTATKADETFKTLEQVLLDLRNAESKLVMGISYDMSSLFGEDLEAIKGVIENASASVENLAKKMHQQLLQENANTTDKFLDNRKLNW